MANSVLPSLRNDPSGGVKRKKEKTMEENRAKNKGTAFSLVTMGLMGEV